MNLAKVATGAMLTLPGMTVLLSVLVLCSAVRAQDYSEQTPIIRVEVEPPVVRVGDALTLRVTVLVPTWLPKPPDFPDFELVNAITRLPPDSSHPTSERLGAATWSGIERNYRVYPLLAATYRLTDQAVVVTYADPRSRQPVRAEVAVPEIEFQGRVPAGAEGLNPYLAGSRLELRREIEGELEDLAVGGAIVVRTIAELDGVPAMFLPPLVGELELDGVSIYVDQPLVEDDSGTARRSERATLVFEAGGEFTLPEIELHWWNLSAGVIETAKTDALRFSVQGPSLAASAEDQLSLRNLAPWLVVTAFLVSLAFLLRRWAPFLTESWHAWQRRRVQSEQHAFRELSTAIENSDPHATYHAIVTWLGRVDPSLDIRSFAEIYGGDSLASELDELSRSVYGDSGHVVDLPRLGRQLAAARKQWHQRIREQRHYVLPPMNP